MSGFSSRQRTFIAAAGGISDSGTALQMRFTLAFRDVEKLVELSDGIVM